MNERNIIVIIINAIVNVHNIFFLKKKSLITLKEKRKRKKRQYIVNNLVKSFFRIYIQNCYFILMLSKYLFVILKFVFLKHVY